MQKQPQPEIIAGLGAVDGVDMVDAQLFIRNTAMTIAAAIAAERSWVVRKKIPAIVIASAEIFRVDAFQFVVPPAADAADFAFFALFRLNPVHILSGTADRREAPEGLL